MPMRWVTAQEHRLTTKIRVFRGHTCTFRRCGRVPFLKCRVSRNSLPFPLDPPLQPLGVTVIGEGVKQISRFVGMSKKLPVFAVDKTFRVGVVYHRQ